MIRLCKPEMLLADLQMEFPQAPLVVIQRQLSRAVEKFADVGMNSVWVSVPVQQNVQHYPFERHLPKDFKVQGIQDVRFNGCCLRCVDDDCKAGCLQGYRVDDLHQITLIGYCPGDQSDPECQDTLEVKVCLRYVGTDCMIPCDILERFSEALRDGAMAHMFGMTAQPWTDYRVSEYHQNQFLGGIASAKCVASRNGKKGNNVVPGECLM